MLAAELLEEAADACHADLSDVLAGRRMRPAMRAKQAAIYALRHYRAKPHTFGLIGHLYGTDGSNAKRHYVTAEVFRQRDRHFRELTDILIEHARDAVFRQRVGRGRRNKPLVPAIRKLDDEALLRNVYAVFSIAAELLDADLGETLAKQHRNGPEFEASAATVWALRRGSMPQLSFPQIGRFLARHYSTIIHADRRADELRTRDPDFAQATQTLLTETQKRLS